MRIRHLRILLGNFMAAQIGKLILKWVGVSVLLSIVGSFLLVFLLRVWGVFFSGEFVPPEGQALDFWQNIVVDSFSTWLLFFSPIALGIAFFISLCGVSVGYLKMKRQ